MRHKHYIDILDLNNIDVVDVDGIEMVELNMTEQLQYAYTTAKDNFVDETKVALSKIALVKNLNICIDETMTIVEPNQLTTDDIKDGGIINTYDVFEDGIDWETWKPHRFQDFYSASSRPKLKDERPYVGMIVKLNEKSANWVGGKYTIVQIIPPNAVNQTTCKVHVCGTDDSTYGIWFNNVDSDRLKEITENVITYLSFQDELDGELFLDFLESIGADPNERDYN